MNMSVFCTVNKMRQKCCFIGRGDIHTFYSWRKVRTRGVKMVQWNNRERKLPDGHRPPRDTSMSFWFYSSAFSSEQEEGMQLQWMLRRTSNYLTHGTVLGVSHLAPTPAPRRDKGWSSSQQLYSAKNTNNYAPRYGFWHTPATSSVFGPNILLSTEGKHKKDDQTARSSDYNAGRVRF
jgi:hypothetical protein